MADKHAVAELGQQLWFEKRYAGKITEGTGTEGALGAINDEQKVSCSNCHNPAQWFTDTRSVPNTTSLGTARTNRNAPSMVNAVCYDALIDPRSIETRPTNDRFPPSGKPGSANGPGQGRLRLVPQEADAHQPGVPQHRRASDQMEAVLKLKDFDNDRYLDVEPGTERAPTATSPIPDERRSPASRRRVDDRQARTKSLRHVAETGPYFHNGIAATLADVVRFYNDGGGLLGTYPGARPSSSCR